MSTATASALIEISGGTFEPGGHIYRDPAGRRVISVTQVFEILGMNTYPGVDREVLARKARLGTAVHRGVEQLLQGGLDWDQVSDELMGYIVGAESWFRRVDFQLLEAEHQGIHELYGMKYGFQYDQRGRMRFGRGWRHIIVDLKTCLEYSPTWAIQTAAYALAASPLPEGEKYLRVVLQLHKNGACEPYFFDDLQDFNSWIYMLYVANWKRSKYGEGYGSGNHHGDRTYADDAYRLSQGAGEAA